MINAYDAYPRRAAAGQHQKIAACNGIAEILGKLCHLIRRGRCLDPYLQNRITAQMLKKVLHR